MEMFDSAEDFADQMHSETGFNVRKLESMFDAYWKLSPKDRDHYSTTQWKKFIIDNLK
jgi:hypothetical protein